MIKTESKNVGLISRLVEQFRSKSQYDHYIHECQEKFDINTYRFQQLSVCNARKGYNQLRQKYENNIFQHTPRAWHQNERKIFVWFLLALLRICKQNHKKMEEEQWQELSQTFFNKDILFLKFQWNSIQKNRKRHQWTQHQNQILKSCQSQIQNNSWNQIAKEIYFQTESKYFKSSKQCRERWQNHLDNRIKRQTWQPHEDLTILKYVIKHGKKWSKIVEELQNTRTEHMVKNRFKSLSAKIQNDFKTQQKKVQKENVLIEHIIEEINSKNSLIEKKSSIQNGSQGKDVVEHDIPEIKLLHVHKKSFAIHGVLERNENGEFITTDSFSTRSSSAPNIFESRSPATLSLGSGGFLYAHSLFTPQSCTPTPTSDAFGIGSSFGNCTQKWNRILKKLSFGSQSSNLTNKYFNCGRREQNLKFSIEYSSLQNGMLQSGQKKQIEGVSNNYLPYLEERLNIRVLGNQGNNGLQNSEEFTGTLFTNYVVQKDLIQKSETYEKNAQS